MSEESRAHWERVYQTKAEDAVSWFQADPARSLMLLDGAGLAPDSCVIDVGGGDSRLVDRLLARGLRCVTVLDISVTALDRAKRRVGPAAEVVRWLAEDVTGAWQVPPQDFWHDRAVFHFLIDPADRASYLGHLRDTLKPEGYAIIATFDLTGPQTCSGLPVERYSPDTLARELGPEFELRAHAAEEHRTPGGTVQPFVFCVFRRRRAGS